MLCHAKYYAAPCQILCCAMPNIMLRHAKYYAAPDKYLGYAEKLFRLCRIPKPRGQIIFY